MRRLLVINPNTSSSVSQKIEALVREETQGQAAIQMATASFGFSYISTRTAIAIAAHAVLDAAARALADGPAPDAILLACFGDPGREALEEMTGLPVVGFAEAGLLAAAEQPGTSLIATNGAAWCEMLWELVLKLGIADRIAAIRSIENVANNADAIADFLSAEAQAVGASRIVLGGAGLIPHLPGVIAASSIPVIDPHRIAIRKAMTLAQTSEKAMPEPVKETATGILGLSPSLTIALGGR